MVMDEESLTCPICGKDMEEVKKADLPMWMIKAHLPPKTDMSKLIFIQCPLGHGGVVLIPKMSDSERIEAVREYERNLN